MDQEEEHVKIVYAHFGLAVYLGQVLEHGVINALLVVDLAPRARQIATKETWGDLVDAFFADRFKETLGRLIRRLNQFSEVSPALESTLKEALNERNRLVHHFFRDHAENFMSEAGRNSMITELERSRELFHKADTGLEEVVRPIRIKYGYTDERLDEAYQKMLQSARN